MKKKKILLFLVVIICTLHARGQELIIEYRNDSLFIKKRLINEYTTQQTLDSILGEKSKLKKETDKSLKRIGVKTKITTYYYYKLGIYFRKYNDNHNKFSLCMKLHNYSNPKQKDKEFKNIFSGTLIIAGNILNDKKTLSELYQLNNCYVKPDYFSLSVNGEEIPGTKWLSGAGIYYGKNTIRLTFDKKPEELIGVYIHCNFGY